MSNMAIDSVLAQIRSLSAQAGTGIGSPLQGVSGTLSGLGAAAGAGTAQAPAFGALLRQGIDAVNGSQQSANALADAWERGAPGVDLAKVMVESQKAAVQFRALTEVRNRFVTAYQDIMNMSI
jgi:flagellar hook-basal body complex protein FliE